ncbi:DUF4260 domain-containing protein [Formosa sp. S-31]|uniref:DUF4260 domain-containing protein n=1 Tax=Formosa sp. S-31 TaxID=2790949 RepID=UPI003EB793E8
MKTLLKLEEFGMLLLSVFLFSRLDFAWWWFTVLFLIPDMGFVGYVINNKVGAWCYNVLHHKGIAVMAFIFGEIYNLEWLQLLGLVMFGHAAFDRMLGYGLKYNESFYHTHLGKIGKRSKS